MTRLLYLVSHPIQYQAPLLREIAARPDLELTVLFLRYPAGEYDPGFGRTVRWDIPLLDGYRHARLTLRALVRELLRCDVVWLHGWQGWRFKAVLLVAWLLGRPVLMRGENWEGSAPFAPGWRGAAKRLLLGLLVRRCAACLTIGRQNAAYYRRLGVDSRRLFPMPYAVDNAFFARHAIAADPVALGLPPGRRIVLYAGKMLPRKHPHTLLAAWRRAFAGQPDRPLLVFVGDGELMPLLRQGGTDVHCLGFRNQTELPALYALADVFVLAAEAEAWGLAVNEAMACGTAVIVGSGCGVAHDLVDDSVGRVVEPGNVEALALALIEVLPQARTLGAAALSRVEGWDFRADLAGLSQALASLASGRRPAE